MKSVLVTGGAGFIGSCLIRQLISETSYRVINLDALTYAGNLESLSEINDDERYSFEHVDLLDLKAIDALIEKYRPDVIMHLAAESHVDRSIDGPAAFIETNILGTCNLLEVTRKHLESGTLDSTFRMLHVSTDEVYGDLGDQGRFTERTSYTPSSPYSASKASSDHLVRAWHRTYGLPVIITNCSNNYGSHQFPEKLIPLVILNAARGERLPVYGDGSNVRDWLYVDDHVRALRTVVEHGSIGETYNIGGDSERSNIDVVRQICRIMDRIKDDGAVHEELIEFVDDRPGHDRRYAIDASKIRRELGWQPTETFESGLEKTVHWYLQNTEWCERVLDGSYRGERLGLKATR